MTCTMTDIEQWLDNAGKNDTHMLVVCDTFVSIIRTINVS